MMESSCETGRFGEKEGKLNGYSYVNLSLRYLFAVPEKRLKRQRDRVWHSVGV